MIELRFVQEKEIETIRIQRNKWKKYFRQEKDLTEKDQKRWYKHYKKYESTPNALYFVIVKDVTELIGVCGFTKIDRENKGAELSFFMFDNYINEYSNEALKILLEWGFNNLSLERVYTDVFHYDLLKYNFLVKNGWTTEDIRTSSYKKDGSFVELFLFSIAKDRFYEKI